MIASDSTIYVKCDTDNLNAVDPQGVVKWQRNIEWTLTEPVIRDDGTILSAGATVFTIDPADGKTETLFAHRIELPSVWEQCTDLEVPLPIGLDLILVCGEFYRQTAIKELNTYRPSLLAFDGDGKVRWRYPLYDDIDAEMSLGHDGTIYIQFPDGQLAALNQAGQQQWLYQGASGLHIAPPVVGADGAIYVYGIASTEIHVLEPDGACRFVKRLAPRETMWLAINPKGRIYASFRDRSAVMTGASRYWLMAFEPDGSTVWEVEQHSYMRVTIDNTDTLYFTQRDGLYAYNSTGQQKWFLPLPDANYQPVLGRDGRIYVVSKDGFLYAIGEME